MNYIAIVMGCSSTGISPRHLRLFNRTILLLYTYNNSNALLPAFVPSSDAVTKYHLVRAFRSYGKIRRHRLVRRDSTNDVNIYLLITYKRS